MAHIVYRKMCIRINNAFVGSPSRWLEDVVYAVKKYLSSNNEDEEYFPVANVYSCDEFKVRRCMRRQSHD